MIHIINIFMKWSRSSAKLWEDLLFLRRVCRRRWQTPLWFVYHISDIRHQLAWLLFSIHCQITSKKILRSLPMPKCSKWKWKMCGIFSTRRVMMCGCRAIYGKTCWWCWNVSEREEQRVQVCEWVFDTALEQHQHLLHEDARMWRKICSLSLFFMIIMLNKQTS